MAIFEAGKNVYRMSVVANENRVLPRSPVPEIIRTDRNALSQELWEIAKALQEIDIGGIAYDVAFDESQEPIKSDFITIPTYGRRVRVIDAVARTIGKNPLELEPDTEAGELSRTIYSTHEPGLHFIVTTLTAGRVTGTFSAVNQAWFDAQPVINTPLAA